MNKDWIIETNGYNLRFKRETLLNYAMNRWGLNKASSVGKTSELIRNCAPIEFKEWEEYYFKNAIQKKKDGVIITKDFITNLGKTLYVKLSEVVQNELISITEEECIDYAYNLIINRTYEGYLTEINTIYGQLEKILDVKIEPAPDDWDRKYNVDFYIKIKNSYIGLQIKPVDSGKSINDYQWKSMHEKGHSKFESIYNSKVYFIYSVGKSKAKKIANIEVIENIRKEIIRLQKL